MAYHRSIRNAQGVRVAFVSSFLPRECGIATFTDDVMHAVAAYGVTGRVFAMEASGEHLAYDPRVVGTICQDYWPDYQRAAAAINAGGFDLLNVQYEFGIYGGDACEYLAMMLDAVEIPVVTTLHTLLKRPPAVMRRTLRAVAQRSDSMVVMNTLAISLLERVYGVPRRKVTMIHHGAPEVAWGRRRTIKDDLNLREFTVLSTFGLLSPGKGLEYAIAALPAIVAEHPDTRYLILGQTHPEVKRQHGEQYRETLTALAASCGVAEHVRFIDKFFTKAELIAYLLASDIYVTPYTNLDQVTSGTLAYAMACGRPVVSTPYLHAQFLIGEERGLLVPPHDADSIAEACLFLLNYPRLRAHIEQTNWRYGRALVWSEVGRAYGRMFRESAALGRHPAQCRVTA